MLLLTFYLGWGRKVKFFKFLIGDFSLNDTIVVNKIIYVKKRRESYINGRYQNLVVLLFPIFFIVHFTNLYSLIVTGLSLISVAGALTIMTFNYYRVSEIEADIIFSTAKRFYLSTIFGIFLLFSIFVFKMVTPVNTDVIYSTYPFLITYLKIVISNLTIMLVLFFVIPSVRYLLEGLILILKENIKFNS
jgi:hypothetical protein